MWGVSSARNLNKVLILQKKPSQSLLTLNLNKEDIYTYKKSFYLLTVLIFKQGMNFIHTIIKNNKPSNNTKKFFKFKENRFCQSDDILS